MAVLFRATHPSLRFASRYPLPATRRVLVCGGGVHNPLLMHALDEQLPGVDIAPTCGVDPDHVEAMGFAWLARQAVFGRPGNLPSVTGARGLRVLGVVHHPG